MGLFITTEIIAIALKLLHHKVNCLRYCVIGHYFVAKPAMIGCEIVSSTSNLENFVGSCKSKGQ